MCLSQLKTTFKLFALQYALGGLWCKISIRNQECKSLKRWGNPNFFSHLAPIYFEIWTDNLWIDWVDSSEAGLTFLARRFLNLDWPDHLTFRFGRGQHLISPPTEGVVKQISSAKVPPGQLGSNPDQLWWEATKLITTPPYQAVLDKL